MKKKVPLKLLPEIEAQAFLFSEFLKLEEIGQEGGRERTVQIRNLVDGRDPGDVEFTEIFHCSLWELASGVINDLEMSTQQLKESIDQLNTLYSSRIFEETQRIKKKIEELQAQHDSWVAKEEEELEELIQNRIKHYETIKQRANVLLPCQSFCKEDNQQNVKDQMEMIEILEPLQDDCNIRSSQRSINDCPRACFFNLSDISDSSESEII